MIPRERMSHGLTRDRVALEIRRARRPFLVLVALALLALASAAYVVGSLRSSLPWEDPYVVRVAVDDAKGIVAGKQEVRIAGVPVGRITAVDLAGTEPVLTVSIDREFAPLYRDARLRLRPRTPLEDLYLNVEDRGHRHAGELAGGETISAQRTRTPVEIGDVLNALDPDTRARAKLAIDELGHALPDRGVQLRAAIAQLTPFLRAAERLSGQLAIRRQRTRSLVHNYRLIVEELGRRRGQLTTLVRGGARTLGALGETDVPLATTIRRLPPTLIELRRTFATVRATADALDPALTRLRPAADALPAGLQALRDVSAEARPAIAALRPPVRRLTGLVDAVRPLARDLDRGFAWLLPQAPRLDRITAAIVPCELAVQKFFQNTISVTKYESPRHVAFPRGQVVAGLDSFGGFVNDPPQRPNPSCAPGGPRK